MRSLPLPRATAALILSGLATVLAPSARATDGDLRSVAGMQHHARILLAFAPDLADPRLKRQRQDFARAALRMSERDVALVQVAGTSVIGAHDTAEKLRARFHVAADAYRTLLIGKDGNVALSVDGPIAAIRAEQAIDAMPMRREEVRRAHAGTGVREN